MQLTNVKKKLESKAVGSESTIDKLDSRISELENLLVSNTDKGMILDFSTKLSES